jgi:alkylhydroperoxidase/carboxymuconolactone decarboxylase family protein YurZ
MAFDTKGALEAGYSQEEINAYLANPNNSEEKKESASIEFDTKGALEAGYSQEEISAY